MTGQDLENLKLSVLSRQGVLSFVYKTFGKKSLFEYVNNWQIAGGIAKPVLSVLENVLEKKYGSEVAKAVAKQLEEAPLVSTVDHHGILGHPFFLNSNLIFSQRQDLKYLPIFSSSGVSLNNSSWPGCLLLTDRDSEKIHRISFFSEKQKHLPVFSTPRIKQEQVMIVLKQIFNLSFLDIVKKQKLARLIQKVFLSSEVLVAESFSEQSSMVSSKMWQEVFPHAPSLVYLPIEDLVLELLKKLYLINTENLIYRLIFTDPGHKLLEKYFFGLKGGFGTDYGSFLFWGVEKNGERVGLKRQGQKLVGKNFELNLTEQDIFQAIFEKKIYPTSLLCFLVNLESGMNCLGGFNQINWLTEVKEKFVTLLLELGEAEHAQRIQEVVTDNFAEGNLAFLPNTENLFKATLVDIFLQTKNSYEDFSTLAKVITVEESITTLLPEIYKIAVPLNERSEELLKISDLDLLDFMGMSEKMQKILN